MASIALCMIARDEEALLPECLASVTGAVQQIVLVDTGSRDRTAELARAAGASVIGFEWCDDFAAARNAALAAVSCEWILVLDADERLAPGGAAALARAVAQDDFDCGFLVLYNALRLGDSARDVLESPAARYDEPTALPRLLRRSADLRWEGRAHENVNRWLAAPGRRVKHVDAAIVHYGYTPEIGLARGKKQRNLGLLERWCAEAPGDPVPWTYLAWERQSSSDPSVVQAAMEAAEQGWRALEDAASALPQDRIATQLPSPVPLATVRALHQLERGALEAAAATLDRAAQWSALHPNLELVRAQLAERQARASGGREALARARRAYAAASGMRGRVFTEWVIDGATTWFAATGLGLCSLELGEPEAALLAFQDALQLRAAYTPARLGRAHALIELRRPAEALAALLPLLEDELLRQHADAWLLAALACQQLGQREDMRMLHERAESALASGGTLHPWRMPKLIALRAPPPPAKKPKARGKRAR
jgi:hypothetical protein